MAKQPLPQSDRPVEQAAGHWVLARAGKRVLRPGGLKLTKRLLDRARLTGADVVEFAPGLGRTAAIIIDSDIASYTGIERDSTAADRVTAIVSDRPFKATVLHRDAQHTGLKPESADVVIGEAMLTMQGEKAKQAIVAEAFRVLRPGGRYAIHELALTPDNIGRGSADSLRKTLARVIRVNARPLTVAEWRELLTGAGFTVEWVGTAPMALLSPGRNLRDEGPLGVLRILRNVLRDRDLRRRVLTMRKTFNEYRDNLAGVALVARVPELSGSEQQAGSDPQPSPEQ